MLHSSALATLIELANQRTNEAVRALGEAVRSADAAREKHALLVRYRDDYASRFQSDLMRGLSAPNYSNYRSFLGKLESAACRQEKVLRDAEGCVETRRDVWKAAIRKRDAFIALADRMKAEKKRLEARRDQRLTDDIATRSGHVRRQTCRHTTTF
jgi:flagellar protein FliJ